MNACTSVEAPVGKLLSKFSSFIDTYNNSLDGLLSQISTLRRELLTEAEGDSEITVAAVLIWEHCLRKVREVFGRLSMEHREMHGCVSKCGREIDHHFVDDFSSVCQKNCDYECDPSLRWQVDTLIAKHFLTVGRIEISELLCKESHVLMNESNKFLWAQAHKDLLERMNSQLLFNLHKMKFIEILRLGISHQSEALKEAKVFQYFMEKNRTVVFFLIEVETLMGSLLFLRNGYKDSPYAELFSDAPWSKLCDMLSHDWCTIYNVPVNSPLSILLEAGTRAVPALLNIQQVMQQRRVSNIWGHSDELPVSIFIISFLLADCLSFFLKIEINLGPQNCYHSVFCCPILRQQTTDQNPPMRLNCGHVISREALIKLVTNNKLKCPYCPQESLISEARLIYF
ncbi:unnamed protein product [Soboliphyme baturini]|uniref:CRA domain-containing protein n=1 Tax=Soboliphyme baturini TaxID=241478 RepID=A0A183IJN3_9BILA|nr:unnamed protein product [Soboliphyme baturini]